MTIQTFQPTVPYAPSSSPPAASTTGPSFKTIAPYFDAVWRGEKHAEVRRPDPDKPVNVGDDVLLLEWIPEDRATVSSFGDRAERVLVTGGVYTGRAVVVRVTHLLAADELDALGFGDELEVWSFVPVYRIGDA